MNKRSFIKFVFVLVSLILSFYFMFNSNSGYEGLFNLVLLLNVLVAITIFMFVNKNNVKRNKHVYNIVLGLFIVISTIYALLFISSNLMCLLSNNCMVELTTISTLFYPIFLALFFLFAVQDLIKETNKLNDILTIILLTLIILVHLRYYLDSSFIHRIIKSYENTYNSYSYISQNYALFNTMSLAIIIHKFNNEKNK